MKKIIIWFKSLFQKKILTEGWYVVDTKTIQEHKGNTINFEDFHNFRKTV